MHKIWFFLLLASLLGCSGPPAEKPAAALPATKTVASTTTPELAVKNYLNWYADHNRELAADFIVFPKDTTQPYSVNWLAAEDWLSRITKTGRFSPTYVELWRSHIRSYADTLRIHPQKEGPTSDFNYDLFLLTQEPGVVFNELQASTFTTQTTAADKALVMARGSWQEDARVGLDFQLSRTPAGKWLLDDIRLPTDLRR